MVTPVKDVSGNPGPNAVTRPNDSTFLDKDVQRKINMYNIYEAFKAGKAPSNDQIDRTLSWVNKYSPIEEDKLSSDSKTIIQDAKEIIETARLMIRQKNSDELIQNFLYSTRSREEEVANMPKPKLDHPVQKDEIEKDAEDAVQHLRTIGKLIFTNSEFRKLLQDSAVIGRDIATDAATKAADLARPTEERLAQADEPAPADSWVGADGVTYGPNDNAPDTGLAEKRDKAKKAKEEAKKLKDEKKKNKHDAKRMKQYEVHPDTASDMNNAMDGYVEDSDQPQHYDADEVYADSSKNSSRKSLRGFAMSKVPQEHRDRMAKQKESANEYLKEKFPQERRDRFIARLKKVIVEQQRHRDYQEAIDFVLRLFENYKSYAGSYLSQGTTSANDYRNTKTFKNAKSQFQMLLERFANQKSMEPIFEAVDKLYKAGEQDKELKEWYRELGSYVRRVLQEPGYITRTKADEDGKKLRESGKKFFDEKYKHLQDELFTAVKTFFHGFSEDPMNKRFGNDWKKFSKDLFFDSGGNLTFKKDIWSDLRSHILPPLAQSVGAIPIPRIEYSDKETDLVIENLILESQNILPNIIEVEAKNYFSFSAYKDIKDKSKHSIWVSFSQVQADLRNVAFYYNRKAGFPKLKDHGLADVFLMGKGIHGKVHLESSDDPHSYFKIKEIKVKCDNLKFKIRNSGHQILYATMRPLATRLIKKQISKAASNAIRSGLMELDSHLVELRDRYDETKGEDASMTKMDLVKDVFGKKDSASEKSEPKGRFQIVSRRESRIIDYTSPNSMVERASKGTDEALSGEGWKSPIFDVVNLTDPSAEKVEGKQSAATMQQQQTPAQQMKQQPVVAASA